MAGFKCPFCQQIMSVNKSTYHKHRPSFDYPDTTNNPQIYEGEILLEYYKCPNCNEITISSTIIYDDSNTYTPIRPRSEAKQYPNYIPIAIRQDYEEAYSIINLSPKASATLSRRCLQGIIHDFWDIKLKNLNQEITALKEKIAPDLWEALDNLRQLGNIGAHMEYETNIIIDNDQDEAQSLIKLIELLLKEWYINREERKILFSNILSVNNAKQELRIAQKQSE